MNTKKIISLIMCTAIAGGLCSCGGNKETKVDTLTWYLPTNNNLTAKAEVEEEINKITVPEIGAKVNIETIDMGAYGEKMRMKMAAGDTDFDLMFVGYLSSYAEGISNEVLAPLTELIDKNAPELWDAIDDYIWDDVKYKDEIYAVPNVQIEAVQFAYGIQKSLAEKYGFDKESIEAPEELEDFLAKVKAGEPDIYPYRTNYGNVMWTGNNYEEVAGGMVLPTEGDSTELIYSYDTPEYQQSLKTLRDWYLKGYIRKDVASVTDDDTDFKAKRYGVFSVTWKPGIESIYPDYHFVKVGKALVKNGGTRATMIGINHKSKNKEKAVKLISLVNTNKELYNLISLGIKDKNYTVNADGKYSEIKDSGYGIQAWMVGNQFNALINENQDDDVWAKTKEFNDSAAKSRIAGFWFSDKNIKPQITALGTIGSEYSALANGSRDSEEIFKEMMQRYEDAGLEDVKNDIQKQIDEFFASKKQKGK